MPWGRIDDRLPMSVKIRGLVDPGVVGTRAKRQRAEAIGVWVQLLGWVSGERSDGFLTEDVLDLFGWPAPNARLLRARFGLAPLLHTQADGQACPCMEGRVWRADFEYLMHDYLDRNPSRAENDVHRAKARELKDGKLKAAVRDRDQDLCRYCGRPCQHSDRKSDAGLTLDHVDPEVADGMSNLVVACRGCNNAKRRRTPEAAGMVLLPAPTPAGSASGSAPDLDPITDPITDRTTDPITDPGVDPGTGPPHQRDPPAGQSAEVYLPTSDPIQVSAQVSGSPGTGRGGTGYRSGPGPPRPGPATAQRIGPPDTPRGPLSGSPYLRTSRPLPEHAAGTPPASTTGGQNQ